MSTDCGYRPTGPPELGLVGRPLEHIRRTQNQRASCSRHSYPAYSPPSSPPDPESPSTRAASSDRPRHVDRVCLAWQGPVRWWVTS